MDPRRRPRIDWHETGHKVQTFVENDGARLHRDPQLCKLRWGLLKQTSEVNDPPGPGNPPHELEGDD